MRFVHLLLEPATAATLCEVALTFLGIAIHHRARTIAGAHKEHPS